MQDGIGRTITKQPHIVVLAGRENDHQGRIRLAENFDDWLRLARSYAVLGESEKAAEALKAIEKIVEKLPVDDPRRQAFEEGMGRATGQ